MTYDNNGPCFCPGTLMRTTRGEVAVERLRVGDIALTASGAPRPIRWLDHRTVEQPGFEQQPVRITAGVFGAGLPARGLRLSPGHPVLVGTDDSQGGHLVPVMCLINGTTVAHVPVDAVTYWHVELDTHDILLAEGLPAEASSIGAAAGGSEPTRRRTRSSTPISWCRGSACAAAPSR